MNSARASRLSHYAMAFAAAAGAVVVKEVLGPVIVPSAYLPFYAAVLLSAGLGGLGPGLLATALSAFLGWYLYLPPLFTSAGIDATTAERVALFVALAAIMTWLVSRRRSGEERLAESEARLRRMAESDMIGVIFWDPDGTVLQANDYLLRLVGYRRADLEAGRLHWNDLTPREYWRRVAAARRQISAAGTCAPFEQELIRRDGSRVAVLVGGAATAETRDRGVSFVLDITERKRAEEQLRLAKEELENRVAERTAALREANVQLQQELGERQRVAAALELSRERFRRISELTSDYAYRFRIEADGKVFLEWHAGAFSRITGFAFEEIASLQRLNALIHPDDRAAVLERTVRLLAGESVTIAFRMRTKSGDYRWLQDYSQPEWDEVEGRVVRVLGATRDVTERRQAEEELRLSEERFALAAAGANDGVWDWNIDTGEVYLSPRWKDILGFADDEIRNEIEEWIARVHTDDREHVSAAVERHLRGETPHFRSEYRLQHKDGSYRWVLSRGVAVRRSGGRPYRMAGSLTDVTPRRQAEEEARRRQAELAQAQRLSTLGEMAAGMAHELNQPLAAIVSYARGCVYRMQAGDAQSAELLYAIEQVAKQALRAGEILQRYRGFVRLGVLRRDWVDLNKLAQEVAQFARAAAREERVAIRLDLASEMPPVLADSVQIEQVLMNLIRNALDAMQGCSGAEIWVRTSVRDEEVEIAVQDEGKGIPEADRDRIFETFFTTKPEGLGMGLSICRSIIDAHGGRLWASSGPGSGAIFRFTVPATNGIVAAVAGDAALAQNDQS